MLSRLALLVLFFSLMASCDQFKEVENPDEAILKIHGEAQGTTYYVFYYDSLKRNIQPQVDSILSRIDSSLSTYKANSIISQFNQSDSCVVIDEHLLDIFFISDEAYDLSGGAFDPTIKPIVDIWGFGSNPLMLDSLYATLPDSLNKDSLIYLHRDTLAFDQLDFVGWDLLSIGGDLFQKSIEEIGNGVAQENFICKFDPKLEMSFNSVAQGYTVDVIAEYLQYRLGIYDFLINVGGEIIAQGAKPSGKSWTVSVEHPDVEDLKKDPNLAIIEMRNLRAIAVSGDYRNYKKSFNGAFYGHTIDPRTGASAKNTMISAAVFAEDCAIADAFATAFMVMGIEEAVPFVEINPYVEIEAFFVYLNQEGEIETYTSSGLEEDLNLNLNDTTATE